MQAIWNNLCDKTLCDIRFLLDSEVQSPKIDVCSAPKSGRSRGLG